MAATFASAAAFIMPRPLYCSMEPTHGDYSQEDVANISHLKELIADAKAIDDYTEKVDKYADLLMNGHEGSAGYLSFGNNKIAKNTGIFNMNSATDCPNADSTEDDQSDTGVCQVPWSDCYAHQSENVFKGALPKRRRQEYLWDHIDTITFADALLRVKERKRSSFEYLRVSESGDFRNNTDIARWNMIARRLGDKIRVYTYSASHKLDWEQATDFVVNQSNDLDVYGDRLFSAVFDPDNIPKEAIFCPFEAAKKNGVETDKRPKCGECTACMEFVEEQPRNVFITVH